MGIYSFATEQVENPSREQLLDYRKGCRCPFPVDDVCTIHPMRPMACGQFNVFDRVCAEGEDAYRTHRGDVVEPIRRYAGDAFYRILPFDGVKNKQE